MKKKSEEKKYIELLKRYPEGLTRIDIRNKTGIKTSTEHDITKRLCERNIVGKKLGWDERRKQVCKKYYLLSLGDVANVEELQLLMNIYKQALSQKNWSKLLEIQKDIRDICVTKKIRDKEFYEFLVHEAQKKEEYFMLMRKCLAYLSVELLRSIETKEESLEFLSGYSEKDLLKIIYKSTDFLVNFVLNEKIPGSQRLEALDILKDFDGREKIDVAFELLKRVSPKIEDEILPGFTVEEIVLLLKKVRRLIILYARINRRECRERLYELYTPKARSIVKDEILCLLEEIRSLNTEPDRSEDLQQFFSNYQNHLKKSFLNDWNG